MMKLLLLILVCISLLAGVSGCGHQDKSKILEQYKYDEDIDILNIHKEKLEDWIKDGVSCYGIVMIRDQNKLPVRLMEVHAKVVRIDSEGIKMEALEDVAANKIAECNKLSLKTGECWEEVDSELFKTRDEAVNFIDKHYPGLRIKRQLLAK